MKGLALRIRNHKLELFAYHSFLTYCETLYWMGSMHACFCMFSSIV